MVRVFEREPLSSTASGVVVSGVPTAQQTPSRGENGTPCQVLRESVDGSDFYGLVGATI